MLPKEEIQKTCLPHPHRTTQIISSVLTVIASLVKVLLKDIFQSVKISSRTSAIRKKIRILLKLKTRLCGGSDDYPVEYQSLYNL